MEHFYKNEFFCQDLKLYDSTLLWIFQDKKNKQLLLYNNFNKKKPNEW
jgi:hypothetical protein